MKKLLLWLGLAVILFGVVLTWGLTRDGRDGSARASRPPDWLQLAADTFTRRSPVTGSNFSPDHCVAGSQLVVFSACALHISEANVYGPRQLTLRLDAGAQVVVELSTHGQAGLVMTMTLASGGPLGPVAFAIPREGADLSLRCVAAAAAAPCRIALVR
jgi:hypothetical protein